MRMSSLWKRIWGDSQRFFSSIFGNRPSSANCLFVDFLAFAISSCLLARIFSRRFLCFLFTSACLLVGIFHFLSWSVFSHRWIRDWETRCRCIPPIDYPLIADLKLILRNQSSPPDCISVLRCAICWLYLIIPCRIWRIARDDGDLLTVSNDFYYPNRIRILHHPVWYFDCIII